MTPDTVNVLTVISGRTIFSTHHAMASWN